MGKLVISVCYISYLTGREFSLTKDHFDKICGHNILLSCKMAILFFSSSLSNQRRPKTKMEFAKKFFHLLPNPVWKEMRIRQEANLAKHEKTAFSNTQKNGMSPHFSPPLNIYSIFSYASKTMKRWKVRFSKWDQPLVFLIPFLEVQWSFSNNYEENVICWKKRISYTWKNTISTAKRLEQTRFPTEMGWH